MTQFIPKPCWDFHSKTAYALVHLLSQKGKGKESEIRFEQKFTIELINKEADFTTIKILSESVNCNNESYLKDYANLFNYSKLGMNMTLRLDFNGSYIQAEKTDDIVEQLKRTLEPANPFFWNHFQKNVIQANPFAFFKGIFDQNYGPIFMFIRKSYDLPYNLAKETIINTDQHPGKTRIKVYENIDQLTSGFLLKTEVESVSESFEVKAESNFKYRTDPIKSTFYSKRNYTKDGLLTELFSQQKQELNSAELHFKENSIQKQAASQTINILNFKLLTAEEN